MLRTPLTPRISILVPAYNETKVIVDSVRSLLALDYPQLEVIVINDGSTDDTVMRLVADFGLRKVLRPMPPYLPCKPVRAVYVPDSQLRLLVVDKENGGKADSLNAGINLASYPLFCCVDADSILEQDALAKTALPFIEDPYRTVATGGLVRVANGCRVERGRVLEAGLPRQRPGDVPGCRVRTGVLRRAYRLERAERPADHLRRVRPVQARGGDRRRRLPRRYGRRGR